MARSADYAAQALPGHALPGPMPAVSSCEKPAAVAVDRPERQGHDAFDQHGGVVGQGPGLGDRQHRGRRGSRSRRRGRCGRGCDRRRGIQSQARMWGWDLARALAWTANYMTPHGARRRSSMTTRPGSGPCQPVRRTGSGPIWPRRPRRVPDRHGPSSPPTPTRAARPWNPARRRPWTLHRRGHTQKETMRVLKSYLSNVVCRASYTTSDQADPRQSPPSANVCPLIGRGELKTSH